MGQPQLLLALSRQHGLAGSDTAAEPAAAAAGGHTNVGCYCGNAAAPQCAVTHVCGVDGGAGKAGRMKTYASDHQSGFEKWCAISAQAFYD